MTQMNWWQSSKKIIFISLLLCLTQVFSQQWVDLQTKYSGYDEYILQESQSYNISVENDRLNVTQDNHYESVILSDLGIHNNQESFTFSQLVPVLNYEAYTVVNKKGKEKKIPVTKTADISADQQNVFHSDVKEKKLTFSNLEIGAKKVYSYKSEFLDPYLLHKFIFSNIYPSKSNHLEIITDKNVEIGYKIFNDLQNRVVFSKTEKRGKNIYTWSLNDVMPIKYEINNPGYLHIAPHIIFYIKNYTVDDENIPVLGNIDNLYKYYTNFTKDINLEEDRNLKEATVSITEGLDSDKDKVKAILYWVKDNIKYVAFEDGYEGFIPREAKLVFERRFGDCKDMSSIITTMAKYAGVSNVNLTWIGTRSMPYSYYEIATPAVDDHMIAAYDSGKEIIFLDGTDEQTVFGLPSGFIQGKEALIQNGGSYKVVKVPVVEAEKNLIHEKINLNINEKLISGNGTVEMNGLARSAFLSGIGDSQNKDRFEIIKSLLTLGNNKFLLKNYKEENIGDRDLPYKIDYDFDIDNYLISVDKETYLNLFLKKPLEKVLMEKDRIAKYEFEYLMKESYSIMLEIPEGYKVEYLPENISFDNSLLKYDIQYARKENSIFLDFTIETKKLLLEADEFQLWDQSIKNLNSIYNETIILTQNNK